ncbi:MFS transporter [Actinoplanes solisilvae]|uniref:MFS transporter n=1 Tax=Actinoplanes solisilvae TaxID=2486853 RepID=UPI000FDA85BF|nr:MFS transporter [Actinoplanes solisilvae]
MHTGRFAVGRYLSVFRVPAAARFFVPAAVARLGVAMSGLGVMWAVQGSSASFGRAGAAAGAFAVADAVVGPQIGRLIDRRGQRRVVPVTVGLFVAAAVGLVLAHGVVPVMIGLAALAGATVPPVGALATARWRKVLGSSALLSAALSLEGSLNDVVFLVGPILVTTLSATVAPWLGLVVAVSLVAVGIAGLVTARATEPGPSRSFAAARRPASGGAGESATNRSAGGSGARTSGRLFTGARGRAGSALGVLVDRRLLDRRVVALFAVNLAIGLFFGGIGVAITAFALAHQAGAWAGVITGVAGVVSLGAGLVYGALENADPRVMIVAGVVLTAGCGLLAFVPGLPVMFAGYAVVGGCVALVLIPASVQLREATVSAVYTQAMTWMNSASALGIAVGAPVVGHVVQRHGWADGFLVLAALTAALPVTLLISYRMLYAGVEGEAGGS